MRHPLWQRLEGFSFDDPEASFCFSDRLARETGWSLAKCKASIEEYRRFLFLALECGHPVSPSEAVDEVWHLHLLYTESYWIGLCQGVLHKPFHHGPTKGGAVETAKFDEWYAQTLQSYRASFGEEPPLEFWPPVGSQFGKTSADTIRNPDPDRYWLVQKPSRRMRRALALAAVLAAAPAFMAMSDDNPNALGIIVLIVIIGIFISTLILQARKEKAAKSKSDKTDGGCGIGSGCGGDSGSGGSHHSTDGGGHSGHGGDSGGGHGCGGHGCGGHGCGGGGCGGGGH